jgi:copper chaperone NosL
MKHPQWKFHEVLNGPLQGVSRVMLVALVVPLLLTFTAPLWNIYLVAPQYPEGLTMDIWCYKVVGGDDGNHLQEINILNHYIGMRSIDREALADLDWMPMFIIVLALLALRVAVIGNVRSLVDLVVLATSVSFLGLGRFAHKLYVFGHELDPTAPFRVAPFMPPLLGTKQIANFTTSSYPRMGSVYLGIFVTGIVILLGWQLMAARRRAIRAVGAPAAPREGTAAAA